MDSELPDVSEDYEPTVPKLKVLREIPPDTDPDSGFNPYDTVVLWDKKDD